MAQHAISLLSASNTGAPYVSAKFAPERDEATAFDLEVVGRIPESLNGRLLRIGPNPVDEHDPMRLKGDHWFAGNGIAPGPATIAGRPASVCRRGRAMLRAAVLQDAARLRAPLRQRL